jgi:sugar/nucleoside kinase (ribokinase family)
VNFISGFELTLDTARLLRRGFTGPIYADLHSLFLGVAPHGLRVPRPLPEHAEWFGCFDVVQLNEDEMGRVGSDPLAVAATAFGAGVRLLVVTLGERGAVYFSRGEPPLAGRAGAAAPPRPIQTARIPAPAVPPGDTTGCGDAFGATLAARLLAGDDIERAIREANAVAARNVQCRGAGGLLHGLRGGITVA